MAIKSDILNTGNRNKGTARTARQKDRSEGFFFWNPKCENRDSSVGIMTTLQAGSHSNLSSIRGKGKIFTAQFL